MNRPRFGGGVACAMAALVMLCGGCSLPGRWGKQEVEGHRYGNEDGLTADDLMDYADNVHKGDPSLRGGPGDHPWTAEVEGSSSNSVVRSFNTMRRKTAEALKIEPKVVPADDPLRLSSPIGEIDPEVRVQTARLRENAGNMTAAREQYAQALKTKPDHLPALIGLARLHDRAGEFDKAKRLYQTAIKHHPKSALAHNDLALCHARTDQFDAAIVEFEQAIKLQGDKQLYRNNIATVLVKAGRPDAAREHLRAAHGPAAAHFNLGLLLHKNGQTEAAAAELAKALNIDPSLDGARRMLASLEGRSAPSDYSSRSGVEPLPPVDAAPSPDFGMRDPSVQPTTVQPSTDDATSIELSTSESSRPKRLPRIAD